MNLREAAPAKSLFPAPSPERGALKIVLVDDEVAILRLWRTVLESAGHAVTCCREGASALLAIKAGCDCVITDYQMPGLDGIEVIRRGRQLSPARFIMMTAHSQPQVSQAALRAGACWVAIKPVSPMAMLEKLADLFSSGGHALKPA